MKRCVVLTSEYPPWTLGGVGRYCAEIMLHLAQHFDVHVVLVPSYQAPTPAVGAREPPVPVHVYGGAYRDALLGVGAELAFASLVDAAVEVADWSEARLGTLDSAIVYAQEYSLAPIAAAMARRRGVQVVAACHLPVYAGFTYFDKPVRDAIHQVLEAKLLALARRIVVPSTFAARVLALTHNVGGKVAVVPLGAARPGAVRRRTGARTRLLAVGRSTEQKGHHLLIEAFERLHAAQPALRLTVLCGNEPTTPLLQRVRSSPARAAILLPQAVPHTGMWHVYDEHDLLISTSLYETFGLCVLEAMASARVTLGYATPALRELWGDELAAEVGVPVARVDGLVERVGMLLGQQRRIGELEQALQRRAATFTWERHVATLREVMADRARAAP